MGEGGCWLFGQDSRGGWNANSALGPSSELRGLHLLLPGHRDGTSEGDRPGEDSRVLEVGFQLRGVLLPRQVALPSPPPPSVPHALLLLVQYTSHSLSVWTLKRGQHTLIGGMVWDGAKPESWTLGYIRSSERSQ